jgi:hypothetical protein
LAGLFVWRGGTVVAVPLWVRDVGYGFTAACGIFDRSVVRPSSLLSLIPVLVTGIQQRHVYGAEDSFLRESHSPRRRAVAGFL